MAKKAGSVNKSKFIRDHLGTNPKAKLADVQKAWAESGQKDELNTTLFYQARRKMGLGRKRGRKRGRPSNAEKAAKAAAAPAARTGRPGRPPGASKVKGYQDLESQLDQLVRAAESLGDSKLAEAIVTCRRMAGARLI